MRITDRRKCVVALTILLAVLVSNRTPSANQVPARLFVVSGTAIDDSGKPVADASVTLTLTLSRGGGGRRTVLTDASGRFEFRVTPGVYVLESKRADLIPGGYGKELMDGNVRLLNVGTDDIKGINVRMWRFAAIRGLVEDEATHKPIVGARVFALRRLVNAGLISWSAPTTTATDDRGMFEIAPLKPGEFVVCSNAEGPTSKPASVQGNLRIYQSACYPNGDMWSPPLPITLRAGDQRSDISLSMSAATPLMVRGTTLFEGKPTRGVTVELRPVAATTLDPNLTTQRTASDQSGRFAFTEVVAGDYQIQSELRAPADPNVGNMMGSSSALWANARVTLPTSSSIELQLKEAERVTGHMGFEQGSGASDLPSAAVRVALHTASGNSSRTSVAIVDSSGEFSLLGVLPGEYVVRLLGLPQGWFFKASVGSADVVDQPLIVEEGRSPRIAITLTKLRSGLSGKVVGMLPSQPSPVVLVFPTAERYWSNYGPTPRRLQQAFSRDDGTYSFAYLPEGTYFVVAVSDPGTEWRSIDLLRRLSTRAARVTIGAAVVANQDVPFRPEERGPRTPRPASDGLPSPQPDADWITALPTEGNPDIGLQRTVVRTALISGRVLESDEKTPIAGADVSIKSLGHDSSHVVTDEEGSFAFYSVPSGTFKIAATKPSYVPSEYGSAAPSRPGTLIASSEHRSLTDLIITMHKGASISGTVRDSSGAGVAYRPVSIYRRTPSSSGPRIEDISQQASGSRLTDRLGSYRFFGLPPGQFLICSSTNETSGSSPASSLQGCAPESPSYVELVTAGDVEVDIRISAARLASVSGRITDTALNPMSMMTVDLFPISRDRGDPSVGKAILAKVQPSGSFEFRGVPPGRYSLLARELRSSGECLAVGNRTIEVSGEAVSDIEVRLERVGSLTGQVSGGSPSQLARTVLDLVSVTGESQSLSVSNTGAFDIRGLAPGRYWLVRGLRSSITISAIVADGRDVTWEGIAVPPGSTVSGIVLTASEPPSSLFGKLVGNTRPTSDYSLLLFARQPQLWGTRIPHAWMVRPDSSATYTFSDVQPGDYYVAALTDVQTGEWLDSSYLRAVVDRAMPISIGRGEKKVLNIQVASGR